MSDPTYMQNYLHPPKKPPKPAVKVFNGGREVCNQLTREGRQLYSDRKKEMWLRQGKKCCLNGLSPLCPGLRAGRNGKITFEESTFDHSDGRGGGKQDDRTEKMVDGVMVKINGACCWFCNSEKGSRRIQYNDAP